jgi:hypothetical protein
LIWQFGLRTIFVGGVIDGGVNRPGTPLTSNRIFDLATPEQREQLDADRLRDAATDEAAMLAWREKSD